ncbi:glu S.griseus protease inhibitor-like [Syzygium oleosum]|uniref:glu S.griseus protease inhibitor-like n=1 Tax=Syzygium oleosum TaxID=219896 RepID=UPI0024BBDB74|nr:glu S.griseus protease inhibitor-like [Syzygium oleosum]
MAKEKCIIREVPRYPPCFSGYCCQDPHCCSKGYKYSWPELVGYNGDSAKATIEKDNPLVTVYQIPEGAYRLTDFCCNRVYLWVDGNGNVTRVPTVG